MQPKPQNVAGVEYASSDALITHPQESGEEAVGRMVCPTLCSRNREWGCLESNVENVTQDPRSLRMGHDNTVCYHVHVARVPASYMEM